ncbi:hypothetical protein VKT23_006332 [Stygiomarasmius scandens]|uniref:G domain-containing protein n=1 Tax=Marasmiellus scandens TaxID=2682957 RepID=A0ABR1JMI3_9AGAR
MADQTITPLVEEIIRESERIRILVVGKTGVGKTSLIKKAFNVETLQASHDRVGISNIEDEIISEENDRFVIHDSQGYEPGDPTKFQQLQDFIEKRSGAVKLADKIHVIWLCIATPYAGGRVLETGTEQLLKSVPKDIAMVVVFTKYDELVDSEMMEIEDNDPDIDEEALIESSEAKAATSFDVSCVGPLKRFMTRTGCSMPPYTKVSTEKTYESTLSELVRTTEKQIELLMRSTSEAEEPSEEPSNVMDSTPASLMAMAQMVDVDTKVNLVIRVGKQSRFLNSPLLEELLTTFLEYWRGLASSTHFPGLGLRACLTVLHKDIVVPWNINDPQKFLLSEEFESSITQLVGGSVKSGDLSAAGKHMSKSIGLAGSLAGVGGAAAGPLAPIVAPAVFAGVLFAHWAYETYKSTPDTVRCLMSYIIHLFNIMQGIFYHTLPSPGYRVSRERTQTIVEEYQESSVYSNLCEEIDQFINKTKTFQLYGSKDHVLEKLEELSRKYRFMPGSTENNT